MNRTFDYNGSIVAPSKPVRQLKTVKKTLVIDSSDRDSQKYITNGDFVIYLPRVYENIVSLRLMAAEFPQFNRSRIHPYLSGSSLVSQYGSDTAIDSSNAPLYFLIDIEGLNKTDETAVDGMKSTFSDSFFAKIPAIQITAPIEYNDHSAQDNIAKYTPALGKLDRLHIRTRLHSQQGNQGFVYWTSDGAVPNGTKEKSVIAQYSLTFEIEYLDNIFDDFSSFESRIGDRN